MSATDRRQMLFQEGPRRKRTTDERRAYMKAYAAKNRDVLRAKRKAAYDADKPRRAEASKAYVARNFQRVKERKARWARENAPAMRRHQKKWAESHPDLARSISSACANERMAAKAGSVGRVPYGWFTVLRRDPCSYCGADGGCIDHVEPLKFGGSHSAENIAGSCGRCNSSKGAKPVVAWILSRAV